MNESEQNLEDWLDVVESSTYYELLGLLEISDDASIQQAFHQFCAAFHPDQHRGEDEQRRQLITYVFKRGAEAYRVLRDPELRARYDLGLREGKRRLEEPGSVAEDPRSLPRLCLTPAGRLHASRAEQHLHRSELTSALVCLQRALDADGDNHQLAERVEALRRLVDLQG